MSRTPLSALRRRDVVDALRRGTVPPQGLGALAVGLDHLEDALTADLEHVAAGGSGFKAIRGEYGGGKTFLARWLAEQAQRLGMATAEVQISESETPLHRLETVYRRAVERLGTADEPAGALRTVLERWTYGLEDEVLAEGQVNENDAEKLAARVDVLMERRLAAVSQRAGAFSAVVRTWRQATLDGDTERAEGLLAWLSGQPHVAASVKRGAGVKGELDHFGALAFLQALLVVLHDAGHPGLLLVLDEVETLQRMRRDVRDKGLNALRQLLDEIDAGRFPRLLLVITGTSAFFDGPQGVPRLPPLEQRLHTDFGADLRWDNPRATQVRLRPFDLDRLVEVGGRVRDVYASGQPSEDRIRRLVDNAYLAALATGVAGELGASAGMAPRLFLRKLVGDVLDRVDQFEDFDPRRDYALTISDAELTEEERAARAPSRADDVELDLP
ncbi:BREX system ATP-binding protein BrxD [Baekduia sp. Peel2402]|uniref:BREX system ATP-binding protein BrxD n=1 Tax=Baekduia sp. Peel2402 TaxID=3458296 RepID=UPI00403E9050